MFEINSYILQKMGWTKYHFSYGLGPSLAQLFNDDDLVRFFIIDTTNKFCYLIKEMSLKEKQKTKNTYKFIRFNMPEDTELYLKHKNIDLKKLKINVDFFDSNESLIKLLIKNEAASEDYKRHFKLLKILKQ